MTTCPQCKDREKERKIEENQRKSNVTTVRGRENKRGDREENKKRVQPKRDRRGNAGKRERENSPLSDPENRVASTGEILHVKLDLIDPNGNLSHQSLQILQLHIFIGIISTPQTLNTSSITNVLLIADTLGARGHLPSGYIVSSL